MLTRLHIENYKCLRDVTVDLGDFTVLIGSNDSGKTSFLEVIQRLGDITRKPFGDVFGPERPLDRLMWNREADRTIVWEASGKAADADFTYHVELTTGPKPAWEWLEFGGKRLFWTEELSKPPPDSQLQPGTVVHVEATDLGQQKSVAQPGTTLLSIKARQQQSPYAAIAGVLGSCVQYRFDLRRLRQPSVPRAGDRLQSTGGNLAGILDLLHNSPEPRAFEALQTALHDAIPALQRIVLPPARVSEPRSPKGRNQAGAKSLEFVLAGDNQPPVTIPASQASDGALLLTAFLALVYGETPNTLLIEEPQNGIHASRLHFVVEQLRKISTGAGAGRKRQVILTSHSPMFLSYAKPEEVRVLVRHPELGTQVKPMHDVGGIDQALSEFSAG